MRTLSLLNKTKQPISGSSQRGQILILAFAWLMLSACTNQTPATSATQQIALSPVPDSSPTATVESIPLAARVNDVGIAQQEFEAEVARFEAAQLAAGIDLATLNGYQQRILEALIDQELLVQGALVNDLQIDQASLDTKVVELISDIGGEQAYSRWLEENNYDVQSFRRALQREMMVANMVQMIVAELPATVEHVHARHILVASQQQAEAILQQLQTGENFGDLAQSFSLDLSTRVAEGDLGWFTRGTLTTPEVEQAAFELQPGQVSGIIESQLGFHIVETLERAERKPTSAALQRQREAAVQAWLTAAREGAEIEILIAP